MYPVGPVMWLENCENVENETNTQVGPGIWREN